MKRKPLLSKSLHVSRDRKTKNTLKVSKTVSEPQGRQRKTMWSTVMKRCRFGGVVEESFCKTVSDLRAETQLGKRKQLVKIYGKNI